MRTFHFAVFAAFCIASAAHAEDPARSNKGGKDKGADRVSVVHSMNAEKKAAQKAKRDAKKAAHGAKDKDAK